jgi:predicted DNA-binding transcriptional regulator YafY
MIAGEEAGNGCGLLLKKQLYLPRNQSAQKQLHMPTTYLSAMEKAIDQQLLSQLTYLAANGSYSERQVEPLALYHTSNTGWILIAWCRLRKGYREFRLDRIQDLEILGTPYPPRFFQLEKYFASR